MATVYTIGHSTHSGEGLAALLAQHGIDLLCDVRGVPYSRRNPQFNRETLQKTLAAAGIDYRFLGDALGARNAPGEAYDDEGRLSYDRLARTAPFQAGLQQVISEARERRATIMCAENEPLDCHRTILVARHLVRAGCGIRHILADGSLEAHDAAMARLIERLGLEDTDLFRSREALLEEAYRLRERAMTRPRSANR